MPKRCVDVLVEHLISKGIKYVFTIPGGAESTLNDALYDAEQKGLLSTILTIHEQGAGHMADGYARVMNTPGVAIATSGPGATNLITAAITAQQDSIPLIIITGNVESSLQGTQAFQECNILDMMKPSIKECIAVERAQDIIPCIDRAFKVSMEGRRGVVWVDIPKDLQGQRIYTMDDVIRDLENASKPLILGGHGVILSGSYALGKVANKLNIPVAVTMHGISAMDSNDPLYLGMVGIHGTYRANSAIHQTDLLLAIGCRLDDRVTLNLKDRFAPNARIVRVDLVEGVNPLYQRCKFLSSDAESFLQFLLNSSIQKENWIRTIEDEIDLPLPAKILAKIDEVQYDPERIVVTDVGQNQIWATQGFRFSKPGTFVTSGGAGTMGFALPAAIGIQLAKGSTSPSQLVIMVAGDGGFDMTKCELATLKDHNLPIKMIIINNGYLGMVRQAQTEVYGKRYHAVKHTSQYGNTTILEGTAKAYDIPYFPCHSPEDMELIWTTVLKEHRSDPVLIEMFVSKDETCRPQMKPGATSMMDMQL